MSPKSRRAGAFSFAVSYLLSSTYARVLWMPEEFDPQAGHLLQHSTRDSTTCSIDASLTQCPGDFPPNFCCSAGTTCLHIDTGNSSVTAALCCPDGQSCNLINPFSCDEAAQDATKTPNSQLHSIPPEKLATCGAGCCPMGYSCNANAQCVANKAPSSSSNPTTTSSPTSPASLSTSTPTPVSDSSSSAFNGRSFAAGLVPGIALGAILAVLLIFLYFRMKQNRNAASPKAHYSEKRRDTLTDLSTLHQQNRPNTHGRSISEPTAADPFSAGGVTRTDFLRSSPARTVGSDEIINNAYDTPPPPPAPAHTTQRTPKLKNLFTRSPAPSTPPMTQAPLPAHMKRGTLNFLPASISPIRALKKQKSAHSLRRQMVESRCSDDGGDKRTASTETIQVLMSPDNEPAYKRGNHHPRNRLSGSPLSRDGSGGRGRLGASSGPMGADEPVGFTYGEAAGATESRNYASSSRYPSEQPPAPSFAFAAPPPMPMPMPMPLAPRDRERQMDVGGTPQFQGQSGGQPFLASPYTPTRPAGSKARFSGGGGGAGGGLSVPGAEDGDVRRETTFSTLMEKAGLRKSELVMGTKKRVDGRFGL